MRHCERAVYDAYGTAIYFQLTRFSEFRSDYSTIEVTPTVPAYLEIAKRARQARNLIRTARENEASRSDFYTRVKHVWQGLSDDMETLDVAREELNKKLALRASQNRKSWVVPGVALASAVIGSLITLIGRWLLFNAGGSAGPGP